ncbi:MAG: hypothetical protein ACOH19_10660 [Rhodoglobus sp.]
MSESTQTQTRRPVRVGPIVWGSILLLVASIAGAAALLGTWSATTIVWVVIAFGALIVVAGLIGAIARSIGSRE